MDKRDNLKQTPGKSSGKIAAKSGTRDERKEASGSIAIQTEEKKGSVEDLILQKTSIGKVNLDDLVSEIDAELGYGRDRIIRRVMDLKGKNRIRLEEKRHYSDLPSYFFSPLSLWFWGALVATLATLALISFTSGFALYLRYVFGALLVLFLPGYALVEYLYAKKQELDDLTRIALSIGLSLALVPLIGLVLNYTPFGIRLYPITVSLAVVTIVLLIASVRRKHVYYKLVNDIP
jgi:Protein of unknown function (DUF1616)